MRVRNATKYDVCNIANIHKKAFPGFFLTTLGEVFLRELYSGFLNQPDGILLVAEDADMVVGFVAGTSSPETFFSRMRRRHWLAFIVSAVPAAFRHPMIVVKKLCAAFMYSGDKPATLDKGTLLSSIGIIPEVVGKGVGVELMLKFEQMAVTHGTEFVYLTTDKNANDHANAFYRKCGYHIESGFMQQPSRPMLRYLKKVNCQISTSQN